MIHDHPLRCDLYVDHVPEDNSVPEHHLNEDPSTWPRDPFALLGVERTDDERTVRRAYLKLIKLFKPEQNPDEFQRIRQAFEAASSILQSRDRFETPDVGAWIDLQINEPQPIVMVTPRFDVSLDTRFVATDHAGDTVWDELCQTGEDAVAYSKLKRLAELNPNDARLGMKLYWLLRLHPELDSSCHRNIWLTSCLADPKPAGSTAWQLYSQELELDPNEARSWRCDDALAANLSPEQRAALLIERWRGCARIASRQTIIDDITQQRSAFVIDHQHLWAQVLTAAIRQFATPKGESFKAMAMVGHRLQYIQQWSDEISGLARQASDLVFDEVDRLRLMAREWDNIEDHRVDLLGGYWLDMVVASVIDSAAHQAEIFRPILAECFADPAAVVTFIDTLLMTSPLTTITTSQALLAFCHRFPRAERELSSEAQKRIRRCFPRDFNVADFGLKRHQALEICLTECISLRTLGEIADTHSWKSPPEGNWSEFLQRDLSLQVAYAAGRYMLG